MSVPQEIFFPDLKRKTDRAEYGCGLLVYTDSPSRLDVSEAAVKKAKTILRRDSKAMRALYPDMGSATLIEGPMGQSSVEWKDHAGKAWKPFYLPLAWYATGAKKDA